MTNEDGVDKNLCSGCAPKFEGDVSPIYLSRMVTYSKNSEEGPPVAKIKEVLILITPVVLQGC